MKVIAHRGYSGKYPENTMLAFRKAVEAGCDEIELDVQVTKDGVVVVMHDERIDRTTDGVGYIRDYTYEELKKFNAAKLYPNVTEFENIPSFEEYCAWAAKQNVSTNIEIKTGIYYYEDIEKKVVDIIHKFGLEEKVMFSSFNHISLSKLKQLMPQAKCGALVEGEGLGNAGYYCKSSGFEFYHPCFDCLSDSVIEDCKAMGVGLNVWTINHMVQLEQLYKWNCSGVITNFPEVCRAWLDYKKNK